jgi:hypothetical protein
MLAMFRHAMNSTTPASAISAAPATPSPVSVVGDVLVDMRGSGLIVRTWFLFSAG